MNEFRENKSRSSLLDEIRKDVDSLSSPLLDDDNNCFVIKKANDWIETAKSRPIPRMLFDVFWFELEVCILYADTNVGKSILAVQICNSITTGVPIEGFSIEVKPQKVIYFDFELSDKQFEKRYSHNFQDHFNFSDNFYRAEINPEGDIPKEFKNFEEFLVYSIILKIKTIKPSVLVIDNLTYLKDNNESAKDALPLMKQLKAICRQYKVSILVLAHTPKRDCSKFMSRNDLAGSKMLINFCDSAFAIGESASDSGLRYLKQIKQRNTECVYNQYNVATFQIVHDYNFLKFGFVGFDEENTHLNQSCKNDVDFRNQEIFNLKSSGLANTTIAKQLGVSEGTVRNVLKKYNND